MSHEQAFIHVYRQPGTRWPNVTGWVWAITDEPDLPMTRLLDGGLAPDIFAGARYGFASTRRGALREARRECRRSEALSAKPVVETVEYQR